MVFAKGNSGKRKEHGDVDLYISRFRNGVWSEPLMININRTRVHGIHRLHLAQMDVRYILHPIESREKSDQLWWH